MEEHMKQLEQLTNEFMKQYYTTIMTARANLINFYTENSSLSYGGRLQQGMKAIKEHIEGLSFTTIQYMIEDKDIHPGVIPGSFVVMVVGRLCIDGQSTFNFSQSFTICPNGSGGLYIHSDIFRIVT